MTQLQRSAVVAYTPAQMFELVNGVEAYPQFLPWCRSGRIESQTGESVEATLEIAWCGFQKSFTTRNRLQAPERIDIELVKGPFRHLGGYWTFLPATHGGCQVTLTLEFELAGHFFDRLFQPVFYGIANSLVDAFCRRAVTVYGHN